MNTEPDDIQKLMDKYEKEQEYIEQIAYDVILNMKISMVDAYEMSITQRAGLIERYNKLQEPKDATGHSKYL